MWCLTRWVRMYQRCSNQLYRCLQAFFALSAVIGVCACGGDPSRSDIDEKSSPAVPTNPNYWTHWLITADYGGFKLLFDCTLHSAIRYEYLLKADLGNGTRTSSYKLDPTLPRGCAQQTTTESYASVIAGWDRGHLVTSNHMDNDPDWMQRANYMSNIVPQVSSFNQGIWQDAENVAECYRDLAPVWVYGGVVYSDSSNDFFLGSHGIPTPDFFWKALVTTDSVNGTERAISWYIPNRANLGQLDTYLVSINELESMIGEALVAIPVSSAIKSTRAAATWKLPVGCSLS